MDRPQGSDSWYWTRLLTSGRCGTCRRASAGTTGPSPRRSPAPSGSCGATRTTNRTRSPSPSPTTPQTIVGDTIDPGPLSFRELPGATWTGDEFIVFGGDAESSYQVDDPPSGDAAAYDPDADSWRELPPPPIPNLRDPSVLWTGSEVLVWGGSFGPSNPTHGGRVRPCGEHMAASGTVPAARPERRDGRLGRGPPGRDRRDPVLRVTRQWRRHRHLRPAIGCVDSHQ